MVEMESLVNDGTGIVLFALALEILGGHASLGGSVVAFVVEVAGAGLIGVAAGWLTARLVRRVDDHLAELTITALLAYGTYLAADALGLSGVIATLVAAGTFGAVARPYLSVRAVEAIDIVWELVAFLLTAGVFLLVGPVDRARRARRGGRSDRLGDRRRPGRAGGRRLRADRGGTAVARRVARSRGRALRRGRAPIPRAWLHVLFWAGLRGAVSVALALSLPADLPNRDLISGITFGIVLFTLVVQGSTAAWLVAPDGRGAGRLSESRDAGGTRRPRPPTRRRDQRRRNRPRRSWASAAALFRRPAGAGSRRARRGRAARSASGRATRCSRGRAGRSRRSTSRRTARTSGRCRTDRRAADPPRRARPARPSGSGRIRPRGSSGRSSSPTRPSRRGVAARPARCGAGRGEPPALTGPARAGPGGAGARVGAAARSALRAASRRPRSCAARFAGSRRTSHAALIAAIREAASGPRRRRGGISGRAGGTRPGSPRPRPPNRPGGPCRIGRIGHRLRPAAARRRLPARMAPRAGWRRGHGWRRGMDGAAGSASTA